MKPVHLLYILAVAKVLLPFFLQDSQWEPHRDELLYLAEARHMAWGYMEAPPLLSVFAWLTNLMGGAMWAIKIWPSLAGALTYALAGHLVLHFGGRWFALVLAWLPFIAGAWLRMHFLFQPNFLDIFWWTAMAYGLIRFKQTGKPIFLYMAGLSLGLGMLSKYTIVFYAAGLLGGLILTWDKQLLSNRHFYLAAGLGLLICLPNLWWQAANGYPIVYHMKALQDGQLQYLSPWSFLTDQLLFNLAGFFIWITGLIWAARTQSYRFMAWAFLITIALLMMGHGKSYYSQGAYPVLFALGATQLEAWAGKWWKLGMVAFILFIGYTELPLLLPTKPPAQLAAYYQHHKLASKVGVLQWEDQQDHALPQDFADMLAWEEITQKVAKAYNTLDSSEKAGTLLFCDNYGQAGAVNYYGAKYHLPPAYSDNASFLYWMPPNFEQFDIILLVTHDKQEMQYGFMKEFNSTQLADSITNPYAREHGSLVILMKGPSEAFRQAFRDKINQSRLKTTAAGATQLLKPSPLDEGGTMH
ncbi:Dolichyl-phosphate-mannose-protein mannosyltransferase [Chitinophaga jiangningensis]|uniref:Dolichyl-phosphate-mannose-protein mannosyltransferase n=1 Tax=Chitinophaga jiangningensis TaxID=1419482 RepID=A0A1M7KJE9_9BACT|nr:glycosyltransferase family 39 protein [Chitinophaga jiangningensis]SHM65030.1 Dolichyl-phosphate-mannose-protein mannosyltransferase [Chitinophaga jiangningensis]